MKQEILDEILNQDYTKIKNKISKFLVDEINQRNSNGVIFGLSGGIDSSVIAYLCAQTIKEKSIALIMPDSKVSPKQDTEDALKIVDTLRLEYKLIDINPMHSSYSQYLEPNDLALGNLRARIRANILYYYANSKNYLVLGSSDRSEFLIGYFTKFGDGSADLLPIVSLYKSQVRKFAEHLGVPNNIISKKSSPNLWKGHDAEEELGATYDEIDSILYCVVDKSKSVEETTGITGIDNKTVDKIYQLYKKSEHKRITPKKA